MGLGDVMRNFFYVFRLIGCRITQHDLDLSELNADLNSLNIKSFMQVSEYPLPFVTEPLLYGN